MKRNILIMACEKAIPREIRTSFANLGFELFWSPDSPVAERILQTRPIDLLLVDLDVHLPNGWSDLAHFTHLSPNLCTIGLTERTDARETALLAGLNAVAEKPLDAPALLRLITHFLETPPSARTFRYLSAEKILPKQPNRAANRGKLSALYSGWGIND